MSADTIPIRLHKSSGVAQMHLVSTFLTLLSMDKTGFQIKITLSQTSNTKALVPNSVYLTWGGRTSVQVVKIYASLILTESRIGWTKKSCCRSNTVMECTRTTVSRISSCCVARVTHKQTRSQGKILRNPLTDTSGYPTTFNRYDSARYTDSSETTVIAQNASTSTYTTIREPTSRMCPALLSFIRDRPRKKQISDKKNSKSIRECQK